PAFPVALRANYVPRARKRGVRVTTTTIAIITTEFSRLPATCSLRAHALPIVPKRNAQPAAAVIASGTQTPRNPGRAIGRAPRRSSTDAHRRSRIHQARLRAAFSFRKTYVTYLRAETALPIAEPIHAKQRATLGALLARVA